METYPNTEITNVNTRTRQAQADSQPEAQEIYEEDSTLTSMNDKINPHGSTMPSRKDSILSENHNNKTENQTSILKNYAIATKNKLRSEADFLDSGLVTSVSVFSDQKSSDPNHCATYQKKEYKKSKQSPARRIKSHPHQPPVKFLKNSPSHHPVQINHLSTSKSTCSSDDFQEKLNQVISVNPRMHQPLKFNFLQTNSSDIYSSGESIDRLDSPNHQQSNQENASINSSPSQQDSDLADQTKMLIHDDLVTDPMFTCQSSANNSVMTSSNLSNFSGSSSFLNQSEIGMNHEDNLHDENFLSSLHSSDFEMPNSANLTSGHDPTDGDRNLNKRTNYLQEKNKKHEKFKQKYQQLQQKCYNLTCKRVDTQIQRANEIQLLLEKNNALKSENLQLKQNYCELSNDYNDLINLCNNLTTQLEERQKYFSQIQMIEGQMENLNEKVEDEILEIEKFDQRHMTCLEGIEQSLQDFNLGQQNGGGMSGSGNLRIDNEIHNFLNSQNNFGNLSNFNNHCHNFNSININNICSNEPSPIRNSNQQVFSQTTTNLCVPSKLHVNESSNFNRNRNKSESSAFKLTPNRAYKRKSKIFSNYHAYRNKSNIKVTLKNELNKKKSASNFVKQLELLLSNQEKSNKMQLETQVSTQNISSQKSAVPTMQNNEIYPEKSSCHTDENDDSETVFYDCLEYLDDL